MEKRYEKLFFIHLLEATKLRQLLGTNMIQDFVELAYGNRLCCASLEELKDN